MAISLYTVTNSVLLGIICGPYILGVFTSADKLRQAIQGLFDPISQALYPKISRMVKMQSSHLVFKFLRKLLVIQPLIGFVISAISVVSADFFIPLIYGNNTAILEIILVFKILAWTPFIVSISNVLGIQTLLTTGHKREFSRIVLFAGVFNVALISILAFKFNAIGAAISIIVTECIVTICMIVVILKLKIPLFGRW